MSTPVPLPALGESVTEGTISRWLKQVGDRVEMDEPLVEVSTDKVDTEIPSPAAGVILEILVPEDGVAPVGAVLALIGEPGEAAGSAARSARPGRGRAAPNAEPAPRHRRTRRARPQAPSTEKEPRHPRLPPPARVVARRCSCRSSVNRSPRAPSRAG